MKPESIFLLIASSGLAPIALCYGLSPALSLPFLFDIEINTVNTTHIFRAIMGLYLATGIFWVVGAFVDKMRLPALYNLVVFMVGLAFGRIVSISIDGPPNALLIFYLILEFGFGLVGLIMIRRSHQ
ncbi:hypothetical protein BCU70_10940 [Vibrio sp. 10N.286.49.C2]|uniref:DUF4345 domain-containing protein n=1 Tax=unclassified Vibrio TaxID=2614977 RepID=UPI000C835174|nr:MULTISPECIES: DUF4345 domain-containing protein [unclassified Vibrio]PMH40670.1 hypothetical protein BCU70_10940 [Vibrio sp. 10N.286.49.C2]PMH45201.1 hypothetical protein BCU66_02540 [Vibrio sp. 10N.286.49.B1]PMH78935.1 hypothetical protein BCU58_07500 [Vibrio sp. 10N.286.48.B7]